LQRVKALSGIGKEFMEKSQYKYLGESDQNKGLPQPPLEIEHDKKSEVVDLPSPRDLNIPPIDLRTAIERRRSVREYSEKPLTLEELSWLLWCTQGVKEVLPRQATLRNVPSAGARHPFETYVLVNRVEGLKPGLYRFLALEHKLAEFIMDRDIADRVVEGCWRQRFVKTAAATLLWVAVAYRTKWRYGERGYRYIHLDAGHVCQNLYLAAEAIGCGVCAIGAFYDELINGLLGLDGVEQFVTYVGTVGKKR
jgi:SagB-type dehydrogenase family enzyme